MKILKIEKTTGHYQIQFYTVYFNMFYPFVFGDFNDKKTVNERRKLIYPIYKEKEPSIRRFNYIVLLDIMIKYKIRQDALAVAEKTKGHTYLSRDQLEKTLTNLPSNVIGKISDFLRPAFISELKLINEQINDKLNPDFEMNSFMIYCYDFYKKLQRPEYMKNQVYGPFYDRILDHARGRGLFFTDCKVHDWYDEYLRQLKIQSKNKSLAS